MDHTTWLVIAGVIGAFLLLKRLTLVSPAKAREYLEAGAVIVDVRSEGEFGARHLPKAINIPLDRLGDGIRQRAPDKEQPVLLHCLSGTRSGMGKALLKKLGYRNAFNLGSYGRAARILGARTKI